MTALDAGELDRLEVLAEKATPETKGRWKYGRSIFPNDPINYAYVEWGDKDYGFGTGTLSKAMGQYIAACDPDTIRRLVAMARSASGEAAAREFVESITEPLDVERLAEAIDNVTYEYRNAFVGSRVMAEYLAAEYAALRKPVTA